jgi:hypothetical protein
VTGKSKREFREGLERRHIDCIKYDRYVVLLHVVYSFTIGIFYISPRLRDIAGGKVLGKYTSGQSSSLTVFSSGHRQIGL